MFEKYGLKIGYKKNNVPVLSVANIELLTISILEDYNPELLSSIKALDVDDFIEFYLGFEIEEVHLSHNNCYFGRCVFSDNEVIPIFRPESNSVYYLHQKANTIFIEANLSLDPTKNNLRRFTLMHESGHAVQHKRYFNADEDQLSLFDVNDYCSTQVNKKASSNYETISSFGKKRKLETPQDWLEYQANTFASCMLMNRKSLELYLQEKNYCPDLDGLHRYVFIQEMAETYKVSYDAAEVRLSMMDKYFGGNFMVSLF